MSTSATTGRHFPAFVLLALATLGPSHGPLIVQWLQALPGGMHPGLPSVYRTLQALEADGLVRSSWETGSGPARHVYALTGLGRESLQARVEDVRRSRDNLQFFLAQMLQLPPEGSDPNA